MTKKKPITLVFGDESYEIRPLTLSQVERLEELFARVDVEKRTKMQTARETISIAMSRDHAAVDVTELEVDVQQIPAAMLSIMQLAGFASPGETKAAAGNALTGETSAGGSAQRSAKRRAK